MPDRSARQRARERDRLAVERELESDLDDMLEDDGDLPARSESGWVYPGEERGFAVAVMGGTQRTGTWDPPETLYAVGFMGGVRLDFRQADLLEGVTRVHVLAFMGGVTIIVPRDLDVEVNGVGFMGGFTHLTQHPDATQDDLDRPVLRISGLAFMGGVDVKVR